MDSTIPEMITVAEAEAALAEAVPRYATVTLPLNQCLGRVLREPLRADRAQPPFDRVAMDGIAVAFAAWEQGARRFAIEGTRKAGDPPGRLAAPGAGEPAKAGCLEVMTGAVLPEGADCVIPVEEISIEKHEVVVSERAAAFLSPWKHIHRGGSDCAAGDVIVPEGILLSSPHLGAAAAFGAMSLKVAYAPSVAVIATGDELVDPSRRPAAHQQRRSNPYAVEAALRKHRIERVALLHSRDDQLSLRRCIEGVLGKCDVLILTGGVSMGKTDYVPAVLKELAIKPRFHKIKQKPGKPFWFGVGGTSARAAAGGGDGMPVFALPGNPASVLVCLYRYVLPALTRAMGLPPNGFNGTARAILPTGAPAPGNLCNFRPVTVTCDEEGRKLAAFAPNQGSGDFSGWARSDGFVELAAASEAVPAGAAVPLYLW
jgi:molybdopterin molybdotransferase